MAVQIGQAYIPVEPDLSGFGKNVERQTSGALGTFKDFAKKAALVLGGAFAITKGIDYLKGAVGAASDLNETVSKARTIFGPASADLEKWASNSAKAFGQSRQQALDAAGTFGNLFVQLGIGSDQARTMSQSMVELASDFASFHNANPEEVIQAQTAAFRGEYDALQRFVPTINAAAVEQEALAMSGKKTTKELTLQEKALATQALMMKGAGDATGDFARTSDGLANKQRIFAAQMDDLKAKIGQGLLPVVTTITAFLSDKMVPAFETVGGAVRQVFDILFKGDFRGGPFAEDSGFIGSVFAVRDAVSGLVASFQQNFLPTLQSVGGFVQDNLKPILIGLVAAVVALAAPWFAVAAAVVFAYTKFEVVREVVAAVVGFVGEQFGNLVEWTQKHWSAFQEAISHVVNVVSGIIRSFVDVVMVLWRAWGDDLLRIAKTAFDFVKQTIENVLAVIRAVIQTVLALINGDWGKAWDGIKGIFSAIWDQIKNVLSTAVDTMRSLIGGGVSTIAEIVRGLPGKLLGFAGDMLGAGLGLGAKFLDGLKNGLTAAAGFAGDIAAGIVGVVKNAWNAVAGMINAFVPNSIGWGPFKLDLPDNPIPTFHAGGTFRAPSVGGEGLALLRDREVVTTPENQAAMLHKLDVLISRVDRLTDTQVTLARTM